MEGVGARLGRSSTRYGPVTVFNGPVRKWKKRWVHVSPSATTTNNNNSHSQTHHHHLRNSTSNGTIASTINCNNSSHLLLFKWTPLTQKENNGNNDLISDKDEPAVATPPEGEDPPRRKFKYIPIALLEEEGKEAGENETAEKVDNEAKPSDGGLIDVEPTPDINDIPMEESQSPGNNQIVRQDLNESTLDLSLGLSAHDNDSDLKSEQNKNEQLERVNT